jgi:hypothetical protein
MYCRVLNLMSTDVSEVRAVSIIRAPKIVLMMEAARSSETSVYIQLKTRQYIPDDSELHTRRRENLKSHKVSSVVHVRIAQNQCTFSKVVMIRQAVRAQTGSTLACPPQQNVYGVQGSANVLVSRHKYERNKEKIRYVQQMANCLSSDSTCRLAFVIHFSNPISLCVATHMY